MFLDSMFIRFYRIRNGKNSSSVPEVMIADLIAALLQVGWMALRSAAVPATWGQDMEVPEKMLYLTTRWSTSNLVGEDPSVHAAKIFSPGAVISGCQNSQTLETLKRLTRTFSTFRGVQLSNFSMEFNSVVQVRLA